MRRHCLEDTKAVGACQSQPERGGVIPDEAPYFFVDCIDDRLEAGIILKLVVGFSQPVALLQDGVRGQTIRRPDHASKKFGTEGQHAIPSPTCGHDEEPDLADELRRNRYECLFREDIYVVGIGEMSGRLDLKRLSVEPSREDNLTRKFLPIIGALGRNPSINRIKPERHAATIAKSIRMVGRIFRSETNNGRHNLDAIDRFGVRSKEIMLS